ncbi:hypothetical protein PQX77_017191 [Marasmius sp. AFHP31]|nr:hypothetical protein PQX77_017191 [Marasmius sp. AFHP31]
MCPGSYGPPLPSPAYEPLLTSKPAGQQEASLVLTTANPSPSPPTPSTSTVPLVVLVIHADKLDAPMFRRLIRPVPFYLTQHSIGDALGIGSGVFTQICQDIALAGNGVCPFAVEGEDIFDVSVDWGVPTSPSHLPSSNSSSSADAHPQSSNKLRAVHPRWNSDGHLRDDHSLKEATVPKEVTVSTDPRNHSHTNSPSPSEASNSKTLKPDHLLSYTSSPPPLS